MKSKLIQFIPSLLAIAMVGFTHFSVWCIEAGHLCYGTWLDSTFSAIISPLYFFSLYSLPITIVLIFAQRSAFNSWLKLAIWMASISIVFIYTQPVFPSHILSTDRDDAARLAGEVFTGVSLIFLFWKYLSVRRTRAVS